ncbi:MAG: permease-like cell division protein FtsX [Bacteroidales bacterium]|nr:permease-like cell division protein FtsX [Bacteroidales bacterium]
MAVQLDKITKYRLASSKVSTVFSIALVLIMIGMLGIVLINAKQISDRVRENIGFEVMLTSDITEGQITKLQQQIEKKPYIKSVKFVSKEASTQEMIDMLGHDFRDIVGDIIPPSFQLKINADYTGIDSLLMIEKELNLLENVSDVNYQKSYVNNINENLNSISLILLIVSGVLLIIAIALIGNTIRLAIYSKRFIIKSMLLVGAKRSTIYNPFIFSGIMQGLWGAILAIITLSGLLYLAYTRSGMEIISYDNPTYYAILFGILLCIGIFITWMATWISVHKYIKMKIDKLYI